MEGLAKAAVKGHFPGRPRVELDLEKFLELMKRSGMTKAKACKILGYNQGTMKIGGGI